MVTAILTVDAKGVLDKFHGILKRVPIEKKGIMRDIAYTYRDSLRNEASRAFSYPTGTLVKSIVAKKTGDGWGVYMARYGRFVDTGRKGGGGRTGRGMPPETPQIRKWAAAAGFESVFWFRRGIGRYGTKPRPFISSAIMRVSKHIPPILNRHARKLIGGR